MSRFWRSFASLCFLLPATSSAVTTQHFESAHVHPIEMSPDGTKLFVVHTAGHELAVFDLAGPSPVRIGAVPVGYEPVTVRARSSSEVWVVGHISDAINIVDVNTMSIVRTLLPGDEPTDVQFVESQNRAFVCLHMEDAVAVYDLSNLTLPPTKIALNHSEPRSLALSPDGSKLYVSALDSQNKTTIVSWQRVLNFGARPAPNPPMDPLLPPEPAVGLIVRHDGTSWKDEAGQVWSVPYTMPDHDVITINTSTLAVGTAYTGVGTNLFNILVHPVTGTLYVTNLEASNEIRFEPNLKGKFSQNRVTTIVPGTGVVTPIHLNPHINYASPGDPVERSLSLALPLDMDVSAAGTEIYVAALGSNKIGVLDAAGNVTRRISVGAGPTGVALDEQRSRLYVVNRFDSSISVVDLTDDSSFTLSLGFDPSATVILSGRPLLYDAETMSAHGDLACASCHLFGDNDGIAWELGNPVGAFIPPPPQPGGALSGWHPIKGPMVTQTLKGIANSAPFHWRGDFGTFNEFQSAFTDVQGRSSTPTPGQMNNLQGFVTSMLTSPGPTRNLDNSFPTTSFNGGNAQNGFQLFQTGALFAQIGVTDCVDCHVLPTGKRGTIIQDINVEGNQEMVIPHLRNMHEKTRYTPEAGTTVRGFGFLHDGAFPDLFSYFTDFPVFTFNNDTERIDVEAFMHAFGSGTTHPAVGAQFTMDGTNGQARVDSLVTLANQSRIGLIAKGRDGSGQHRGWVLNPGGWAADRTGEPPKTLAQLVAGIGPGTEITFTAVIFGEQVRLGIDRDEDGFRDRDEIDVGADPEDPNSTPLDFVGTPLFAGGNSDRLWLSGANPARVESRLGFQTSRTGPVRLQIYDVMGRCVTTLLSSPSEQAGRFEETWDLLDSRGRRVSSGTYFVRLTTGAGSTGQRVVVLR
jgi:YVTN family beta-propeller protein